MPFRVVSLFGIGLLALTLMACDTTEPEAEVKIEELVVGEGALAEGSVVVTVDYVGSLTDGKVFDDSNQPGREPLAFQLDTGVLQGNPPGRTVIDGFSEGVVGMRVGGKRRVRIPPNKAYGERGIPNVIPSNATLIFVVDLRNVRQP